jgi:hypothetical protein
LLKDSYDINEVFHKVSKVNTKRNIIGKGDESSKCRESSKN